MRYATCLTAGLACFGIGSTSLFTGDPWLELLFFPWLNIIGLFLVAYRKPGADSFE